MINVSQAAQEQVRAYFKGKKIQPVRIFLNHGGCGGPSLAMALDDTRENDGIFTYGGIDYIMEKTLLEKASPVDVDYAGTGFRLDSRLEPGGGCSACGSTGSCCTG